MSGEGERVFTFCSEPFTWAETKGDKFIVEGYISTGDRDLVGDIATQHCQESMINQMKARPLKLDFEHESWTGETDVDREKAKTKSPLGKAIGGHKDATGTFMSWELNKDWKKFDPQGNVVKTFDEVKSEIKNGFLDAFSIAYFPTATKMTDMNGKSTRLLDDVTLLNVALTGNPVNPSARMVPVMAKSLEYINAHVSHDKDMEENKMTEEAKETAEQKKAKPEVKSEIEARLKAIEERLSKLEEEPEPEPEKPEPEPEKPAEPEAKSERIAALEKRMEQLENTPQHKALMQDMKAGMAQAQKKADEEGNAPLDVMG